MKKFILKAIEPNLIRNLIMNSGLGIEPPGLSRHSSTGEAVP